MVLPYLKGFDINEDLKFYLLWCYFLGIFSISIHFLLYLLQVVSEHFLGQSLEICFFIFFAGIFWAASL